MNRKANSSGHPRRALAGMFVALALLLSACASSGEDDAYSEGAVERLYNGALNLLQNEDFEEAAAAFDEVERQHPYSVWATKAQLMAAYSHYQNNAYDDAVVAIDRFVQLHPSNRDVPYAYYLKSLSYYEQISDVGRDQQMTQLALKSMQDLVTRFPDSKYARDAELKIDLTRDHLAGKEMEIGRYYENQRRYLAAINRFKIVLESYQTTTHVPEALHRLTETYQAVGLIGEARKTAAILGHNFPGNEWYIDSFEIVEGGQTPKTEDLPEPEPKPWYWPF
ncbi:MAG: outer membrane protein assembly factor BamD [Rhodospirillaceae bacterium]|jgi:outer membrane protein assembly factor BamD|nr:outer membrane protein assembly factor BamD [Rhodospirillaceae bacterium]MBT3886614.1 outer membrane protein assembly factor BamD [Rhodospirillaceae bacterium]MBT4118643.1 outer membrane protein assembly factor BamD [Rhodospirillaceae bacterium]MBT4671843.1 outer membrane protein assembly factor BamD [Rhodospirillaceae bacterium]MBT4719269.1 outer membrane protein assembly factor BamD [Rhodospirillaceae bacterium]